MSQVPQKNNAVRPNNKIRAKKLARKIKVDDTEEEDLLQTANDKKGGKQHFRNSLYAPQPKMAISILH